MRKILLILVASITIFSCKKAENIDDTVIPEWNVSWWVVGNDTFTTTKTEKYINANWFNVHHQNATNDSTFSLTVDTSNRTLVNDSFKIYGVMNGATQVQGYFNTHDGTFMAGPYDSGMVYAARIDGKVRFIMPPTIFRKLEPDGGGGFIYSQDTTIVQGVFYEP